MTRKSTPPTVTPAEARSAARRLAAQQWATDPARRPIPVTGGSWIEEADGSLRPEPPEKDA